MLYEKALEEYKRLDKQLEMVRKELKSCPEGNLCCARNGNYYKWYVCQGHETRYIPKKHKKYAELLARKKYLTLLEKDLTNEMQAVQKYLQHHCSEAKAETLLLEESECWQLLKPYFQTASEENESWMNAPYELNPVYPEKRIHKSLSGNMLRSKSEALIDMSLYLSKIPFRYEAGLQLGNTFVYPDFTIRHPENGKYYYWEHFGMMDDSSYAEKAYAKMQLYTSHGIIPSIQLITTFETKKYPLTTGTIEQVIKQYFL